MAEQGYRHYAGLTGSHIKTVGSDSSIYQYTNLETCLAAAQANDVIIIDQGTYSLTAANTINFNLTMIGRGRVIVDCGTAGIATRGFMLNKPGAGTAATYIKFENIIFQNAHASGDVFEIDNDGGATGDLDITFLGCSLDAGASAVAIDLDQTTNTISTYLRLIGRPGCTLDSCNFALTKAASYVHIENYDMSGTASTFTLGNTNVASEYLWKNCIFGSNAITATGAANIKQNFVNCANETSNEVRELAYSDIDAAGNVNIVGVSFETPVSQLVGASGESYSVTSLATAVAAASAGDIIFLEPGSHTIVTDTTLTLNKNLTIVGRGRCTVTGAVADRMIMINKPATGTAATYIKLENIRLVNTTAGADVVEIDNDGGGTGALYVDFIECPFTSNAGLAIDLDQTTAAEDVYLYVKGNFSPDFVMDSCNLALAKAANSVTFESVPFGAKTCALGTADVASIYNWYGCTYSSDAFTSGGAASIIENALNCAKITAGAIGAPGADDFDATAASENIFPAS